MNTAADIANRRSWGSCARHLAPVLFAAIVTLTSGASSANSEQAPTTPARGLDEAPNVENAPSTPKDRTKEQSKETVVPRAVTPAPIAPSQQDDLPGGAHARARRLLYSGRISTAIEVWEGALKREPDNSEILAALGATLYADGQYARALPYLQQAVKRSDTDWTLRLFAATVRYRAGDVATAQREFETIAKDCPSPGNAQIARDKLSGSYFRDQNAAEGSVIAQRQIGRTWIGQLIRDGWAVRATALADDGGTIPFVSAGIAMGGKLVTGGDYVDLFGKVRLTAIAYADHRYIVVAMAWKDSPEEANPEALRLSLQIFDYLLDAARVSGGLKKPVIEQKLKAIDAMRHKDYATAERLTRERLTQSHRDPQALAEYGTIALLAQQWSNAADFCQTSLSVWPDYADGHFCLGGALLAQDRIDDGIQQMREVINVKPTYMEAYLDLAEAYERQSKRTATLVTLTALRELAPTLDLPSPLKSLVGK